MTQSKDIDYDFDLSKTACKELEAIAQALKTDIIDTKNDNVSVLSQAWRSEGAEVFLNKYLDLINDVKKIREEILLQSEQIINTSHKLYILEQEALELTKRKEFEL